MVQDHMTYAVARLSQGWIAAAATERGLRRLTLPRPKERQAVEALGLSGVESASPDDAAFASLVARMESYYAGGAEGFDDIELDLRDATPFQRQVLESVRSIPRGQVRSYGQVAAAIGRPNAARAVGAAMAANPVCVVIPCHRVIGSDGSLTGFGGGVELKRRMLALEGVSLS
ncbi:MAG: methylated-DNA--[protein]-cysteine S-methyltransferase [Dehalococcoidia bacterium]